MRDWRSDFNDDINLSMEGLFKVIKSLLYFRKFNLSIAAAVAVATAILTGALLVGGAVRSSLQHLALRKLGRIDFALQSERTFRQTLADDLASDSQFSDAFTGVAPLLMLQGTIIHEKSGGIARRVNLLGIDRRFTKFFDSPASVADLDHQFHGILNNSLTNELNAAAGDELLVRFETITDLHKEALFGSNEFTDIVKSMRIKVGDCLNEVDIGAFSLNTSQHAERNLYLPLKELQKAAGLPGKVNSLLVAMNGAQNSVDAASLLRRHLNAVASLHDRKILLRIDKDYATIASADVLISQNMRQSVLNVLGKRQIPAQQIFSYLANEMRLDGRTIPYSMVTAVDTIPGVAFGGFTSASGMNLPLPRQNEIYLNQWAQHDLRAKPGDEIVLTYYLATANGGVRTDSSTFKVSNIVRIAGLGADANLSPELPGVSDVERMGSWEPPFPVDLSRIRPRDEQYWDDYRATPKAFIAFATARKIWQSRFGALTAVRFGATPGKSLDQTAAGVENALKQAYPASRSGLQFRPIKEEMLVASSGATDFGMLFISMSFFLVFSAVMVLYLLFTSYVEKRSAELGLCSAIGFAEQKIQRNFLAEAALIVLMGALPGLAAAIIFCQGIIYGLNNWWSAAVGTSQLQLFIGWQEMLGGFFISAFVAFLTIWRAVRKAVKNPAARLLASGRLPLQMESGRWSRISASLALVFAVLFIGSATVLPEALGAQMIMFGGILLLIAALSGISIYLRSDDQTPFNRFSLAALPWKNLRSAPARSLLAIGLIACAVYIIAVTGASKHEIAMNKLGINSGTGGFSYIARSDVGIYADLNNAENRFDLGFNDSDNIRLQKVHFFACKYLPGDDASCLNLYQPAKPAVLGVPPELIERQAFSFKAIAADVANPWTLLFSEDDEAVFPAFLDANSAQWILKVGLGDTIKYQNQAGDLLALRVVGLLNKSIFQSEMLISQENFRAGFPMVAGHSYFLIDHEIPDPNLPSLLEKNLADFGFDVKLAADKLAAFQQIENTYISIFQSLGGLGLIFGTLGLGLILFKNALERRNEMAILSATGFPGKTIIKTFFNENLLLIIAGIALGMCTAIISIAPRLLANLHSIPWFSLGFMLFIVLIIGILASLVALHFVKQMPLLQQLKAEQ